MKHKPVIRKVRSEAERKICAKLMAGSDPWITLGITNEMILRTLKDPLHETFIVLIDDQIVGTFVLQEKGAFTGYLKSIAVKKEWQGHNLGELMMAFIEERFFSSGTNVFLCVSSFNKKAQKFYKKLGYQEVGVLTDYVAKGYDEILMRKTKGPVLKK
ncbi:MAG: N-acetyltransferase [Flavobacteriia bacterium]|nr:MAG: N-acetyltransferase [Flavobacteriia bacterium]